MDNNEKVREQIKNKINGNDDYNKINWEVLFNGLTWLGVIAEVLTVNIYIFNVIMNNGKSYSGYRISLIIITVYLVVMIFIKFVNYCMTIFKK